MFTTTFHLNTQELNDDVIKSIKTIFGKKNIEIVVSEAMDETEYLLGSPANKKHLLKAVKDANEGKNIKVFSPDEFKKLNKSLLAKKS